MTSIAELAERYRTAMIRLGATDTDFTACGVEPPTAEERVRALGEETAQ